MSGFAGSAFAEEHVDRCLEYTDGVCTSVLPEVYAPIKEFSQEEIDEMKSKAVLIRMHSGTFMIEFFPEDAPHTVNNFLKLVESGYYNGTVFHRIIPGFMIQTGIQTPKILKLIEVYGDREDRVIKLKKNLTPYNTSVALSLWRDLQILTVQAHNFL